MRANFTSATPHRPAPQSGAEQGRTVIHVSAPDDIEQYELAREPGESDESFERRKYVIDKLLGR